MKQKTPFQDQVRRAIEKSGVPFMDICRGANIQKATLSRFMHGKGGLSMDVLDRLTAFIGLQISLKGK